MDILKINAQFPMDYLPSMKDFLDMEAKEAEAVKAAVGEESEIESDSFEGATSAQGRPLPSPPNEAPLPRPSPPNDAPLALEWSIC